jgi:MFS superfamily sulfate permease-like transporter
VPDCLGIRVQLLVKLISDSMLTGFKAGAGLTIAITQLPALLGVAGGGHNVPERPAWRDEPADACPWPRGIGAVVVW